MSLVIPYSILELEERIWIAGFGGVTGNREEWRKQIEDGMTKLIQVQKDTAEAMKVDPQPVKDNLVNGFSETDTVTNGHHNGDGESMEVDEIQKPVKAIPLHLQESTKVENDNSRCSTPVSEFTENDRNELVKELADALLRVSS